MKPYLGIDCGSVSIKFALLNDGELKGKAYLKNEGLVQTIQNGLKQLPIGELQGVGVTGSGREFVGALVGADYFDSEIICHMVSCLHYHPAARTILDIGGEDSKLMVIQDSNLADFQMNKDCGGGTGAMIEAIAGRLGINIEDVGDVALQSANPANLPGKCGIFCQSSVVSQLNRGRAVEDILLGVCRALVSNYLAVLAKGKKLLPPVVFQGTTALNKGLVKCFENALGHQIIVPENCSFMGAIGIALLTAENMDGRKTVFRGRAVLQQGYKTKIVRCHGCENNCELVFLRHGRKTLGISGSRCGEKNI